MTPAPVLLTLKQWELQQKYQSIERELSAWLTLTEKKQPLQKHHWQVRRLVKALDGMIAVVKSTVDQLQQTTERPKLLLQIPRTEYLILEVHRTWYYFREKLAARQGPPVDSLLEALDEFAWSCYVPLFEEKSLPTPPLTFFSSNWSPAASVPDEKLPLEQTIDEIEGRIPRNAQLAATRLKTILIPVISLPWFQSTFLPEALWLAHEVGHLVDNRFGLMADLESSLKQAQDNIPGTRLRYWLAWSVEIFADLYGVLCLGPAFVGAIMMRLSRSVSEVLEAPGPGPYPPPYLRMLIAFAALEHLGLDRDEKAADKRDTDVAKLQERWAELYGQPHLDKSSSYAGADFVGDLSKVVTLMLDTPCANLGQQSLANLTKLRWTVDDQKKARIVRGSLLRPGAELPISNPRVLLAGAQLAFQQDPQRLFNTAINKRLTSQDTFIKHILKNREPGTRARSQGMQKLPAAESFAQDDKQLGAELAQALLDAYDHRST